MKKFIKVAQVNNLSSFHGRFSGLTGNGTTFNKLLSLESYLRSVEYFTRSDEGLTVHVAGDEFVKKFSNDCKALLYKGYVLIYAQSRWYVFS